MNLCRASGILPPQVASFVIPHAALSIVAAWFRITTLQTARDRPRCA